jgi:hypothetical protein
MLKFAVYWGQLCTKMIYMNNDSRNQVGEKNVGDSIGLALKWEKQ